LPPFIPNFQKFHLVIGANNMHTQGKHKWMQSKIPKNSNLHKPTPSPSLLDKSTTAPLGDKIQPNIGFQH
jgi:hypothetical protein